MDENEYQGQPLTRERKVGFLFLLLFAILTVGLGVLQLRNTIYGPFVVRNKTTDLDTNFVFADETTRLQQIDTDRDGLNDYEELYFYETSPYLEDTDSDGIDDKTELDQGGDPLCPQGQDCSGADATADAKENVQVGSDLLNESATPSQVLFGSNAPELGDAPPTFDLNALAQDPAALRQIILSTGKLRAEDLEKISDAELMKLVQTIINNQPGLGAQTQPNSATGTTSTETQ